MAKWSHSSNRSNTRVKRFFYLFLLAIFVLFWDHWRDFLLGFQLLTHPLEDPTTIVFTLLRNWGSIGLLFLLILFTFASFLFVIAYYLLPHLTFEQHLELWRRLWLYLLGRHGAAVFVRNGKIIGELGEKQKQGVGLLLIDRQSAVIVEGSNSPSPRLKVYSAGIAFLNQKEKIRGSVDLRPQRRSISDIHAYTKDGIEIVTSLSVTYTLDQQPEVLLVTYHYDSSHTQPTSDSLRVIQCSIGLPSSQNTVSLKQTITSLSDELDREDREEIHRFVQNFHLDKQPFPIGEAEFTSYPYSVDPQRILAATSATSSSHPLHPSLDWSDLPLQITVDQFREFINSIPYQSIYSPYHPFSQTLTELKSRFSKRLRNQGVLAYQFVQRKDHTPLRVGDEWKPDELIFYPVQRLNTPKFLRSKGIKVLNANFGELRPADEAIEKLLFDQWLTLQQNQLSSSVDGESTPSFAKEWHTLRDQMAQKLREGLPSPLPSNPALLAKFLAVIEAEINDPQIRKWLSAEALQRFESLRNEISHSPTKPQPTNDRP